MCECVCVYIYIIFFLCLTSPRCTFICRQNLCWCILVCWLGVGWNVEIQAISLPFFHCFPGLLGITPSYADTLTHTRSTESFTLYWLKMSFPIFTWCMHGAYVFLQRFSGKCSNQWRSLHSHVWRALNSFAGAEGLFHVWEGNICCKKTWGA